MPLALLIFGVVLLLSGWRGTYADLGARLASDFSGFLPWLTAIIVIGAIGYIPEMEGFSNAFLLLVIVVILLSNNGVFAQWANLSVQPPTPAGSTSPIPSQDQPALETNPTINLNTGGSGSSSGSNPIGTATGAIGGILGIGKLFGLP